MLHFCSFISSSSGENIDKTTPTSHPFPAMIGRRSSYLKIYRTSRASPDFLHSKAKADMHWGRICWVVEELRPISHRRVILAPGAQHVHEIHGRNKPISFCKTFYWDVVSYLNKIFGLKLACGVDGSFIRKSIPWAGKSEDPSVKMTMNYHE